MDFLWESLNRNTRYRIMYRKYRINHLNIILTMLKITIHHHYNIKTSPYSVELDNLLSYKIQHPYLYF